MSNSSMKEKNIQPSVLPPNYKPAVSEDYMNPQQLEYFRAKLENWKQELLHDSSETIIHLKNDTTNEPDLTDRASAETDRAIELRKRDRERKLINKIDEALQRIADNSYGYCEETGEPIGLARLEARPNTTLSIEAQERHERDERIYRED